MVQLTDVDRRGLTALSWSNVNSYGHRPLDVGQRLELCVSATVPGPRHVAHASSLPRTTS
ncbi:hypothetical protein FCH28_06830 [Streptomyces piniterrae]|uniref:Uncharacterized protein n=1 Tax=Streptomyces piniterrae TaxID=2571125 RepID=A0A4U0NRU3_9ACTN|nr:hypothetical protein [Streptomyces piniterrae]TJZ57160.1 hypothetical protein FCH28_06830 [Streptomyces piniterrae]